MLERKSAMKRTAFKPAESKPAPGMRKRKCAICREPFVPRSMTHKACGEECAKVLSAKVSAKQKAKQERQQRALIVAERRADKAKLEAMKPAKWWKAKAKKAMHIYVRARDAGKPCASCDTILLQLGRLGGDYDAGHFRSVGSAKHLEFDERNVWGQCKPCNDHKKGNSQEYERRLRILKGNAFVDELLADQAPRHYKTADFQEIEAHYKAKLAALKKEQA